MFTEHLAHQAGHELQPIGRDFREALKTAALSENYKPLQILLTDGLKKNILLPALVMQKTPNL